MTTTTTPTPRMPRTSETTAYYDDGDRRNEVVSNTPFDPNRGETEGSLEGIGEAERRLNGQTIAAVRGQREYKVIAAMGTTDYTRFGFWRQESTTSARRNDGVEHRTVTRGTNFGCTAAPARIAYSPLDPTNAGTPTNTGFVQGRQRDATWARRLRSRTRRLLTGTVRVDVSWEANVDSTVTPGTFQR